MCTYNLLTKEDLEWLENLPETLEIDIGNENKIYVSHQLNTENIKNCKYKIFGHAHKQFNFRKEGITYINPGSIGISTDMGVIGAQFSTLEITNEMEKIEEYKIKYDINPVIDKLKKSTLYKDRIKWGKVLESQLKTGIDIPKRCKEEYIKIQKEKLNALDNKMRNIANTMTAIRKENALLLEKKINEQLTELEMKNASFLVSILPEDEFNKNGLDKVEFLVSTNVGDDFKPLTKIASGGEISRIMLAIKVVLSDLDNTPIMIFDEIDTGISGTAAMSVSQKIKKISKSHQIICVTHLAVVAAKADYNYCIKKEVDCNSTKTKVSLLTETEALNEIARISSGEITKIALQHAQALRNLSIGA